MLGRDSRTHGITVVTIPSLLLPLFAVVDYAVEAANLAHRVIYLRKVLEAGAHCGRQPATESG